MIDMQAALDRLCAIEVAALASLTPAVTADAKAFMIHQQESFPYFTHRVSNVTLDSDSQDFDVYEVEIVSRLVIGHLQEGFRGQPEGKLYTYIPAVIEAINSRELLQSASYTTALLNLIGARVTACSGLRVFENAGVQARQVGTEFTVVCQFEDDLTQVYL